MKRISELFVGTALLFILAACGASVESGSTGEPSGSSTGTGSGASCGGFIGAVCAEGEFCDFLDDQCGAADGAGVCAKIPEGCTKELVPTCGCDGQIHDNPCLANAAGFDVGTVCR